MLLMFLVACVSSEQKAESKNLSDMTSLSFPVFFLSQSLAPDLQSDCFLPTGEDAQHWFPSPEQIASLQEKDLIVQMGGGYESWVLTSSLPSRKLVSLEEGIATIPLTGQTHSHGAGGVHEHKGTNPFTWLDPDIYRMQLSLLKEKMRTFPNQDQNVLDQKFSALEKQLVGLSSGLLAHKEKFQNRRIAANAQSFAYLARVLEIDIHPFDFPQEADFITKHLQEFMSWYVPNEQTLMIWSYEPSPSLKAKFPPEVQHLYIDTLTQPSQDGSYNYIDQHSQNIKRISEL